MLKAWLRVLTKPNAQTFVTLRFSSVATLPNALVLVLLAGMVFALFDILLTTLIGLWTIPPTEWESFSLPRFLHDAYYLFSQGPHQFVKFTYFAEEWYGKLWFHTGLFALFGDFVLDFPRLIPTLPIWRRQLIHGFLGPAWFLLLVAVYNQIAVIWGGRGQFGRFAFLLAVTRVATLSIHTVIEFLPLVTSVVVAGLSSTDGQNLHYMLAQVRFTLSFFIIMAYWAFLVYFPMRIEHGLSCWRAIVVVVLSYLLFFVIETFVPLAIPFGMLEAARLYRAQ